MQKYYPAAKDDAFAQRTAAFKGINFLKNLVLTNRSYNC